MEDFEMYCLLLISDVVNSALLLILQLVVLPNTGMRLAIIYSDTERIEYIILAVGISVSVSLIALLCGYGFKSKPITSMGLVLAITAFLESLILYIIIIYLFEMPKTILMMFAMIHRIIEENFSTKCILQPFALGMR
eukprot:TRINITY_DN956_c0_g1_i1.p3 TRINITY_DN956_c0_g1~~TRINITY_DN956_c0_g1_i1.p3  ORF type:complete len:137 (+),score=1.51 TRINITY_DN956_c0_g1_i1:215-625(+)